MIVSRTLARGLGVLGVFLGVALLSGCPDGADEEVFGQFQSSALGGTRVRFDPLSAHIPEIPFPNDTATVLDASAATGRRLNIRTFAPTVFEQRVRHHLDELDGFGTFAPISVAFDAPLDLHTVSGETVLLVDLGPSEPYWGSHLVPLDAQNNGNFPIHIRPFFFPEEHPFPHAETEQLLFAPDNRMDLDGDGEAETLTFYERETNTLLVRPLLPLRQATEYLVVLTKGLKGEDGLSVRSPFDYIAHSTQLRSVQRAMPYLREAGLGTDDIAFAWSFTTQTITPVLEKVRDGMDGEGPLAFLENRYPAVLNDVSTVDIPILELGDNPYLLDTTLLNAILEIVKPLIPEIENAALSLENVAYVVMGNFVTPNFRATQDETFDIDLRRGTATVGEEDVPFLLCVPKTTETHQPPFPVTLYCHGNQSIRFEAIASANYLAKQGIAVMAIDAVGHGPILNEKELLDALAESGLPEDLQLLILQLVAGLLGVEAPGDTVGEVMESLLSIGFLQEVLVKGRAVDVSGDGYPDNGANFWTADTFNTRDVVRQTVIDLMRLLRILKALDPDAVPPPIDPSTASDDEIREHLMAGDFNLDGRLDVGGADNVYYQSGISLGGIVSSIVTGVEPGVAGSVPIVPGGGLSDVMLRSDLKDVMHRIYYEVLGPVILGLPEGEEGGPVQLRFQNNLRQIPAGQLRTEPQGRVYGFNPSNGEDKWVEVDEDGAFVIGVPADEGDPIELVSYGEDGGVLDHLSLVSPLRGFGLDRNTPRFRRFVGLAQITMDPGDPINYAPHWFMDPLPGSQPKNVLQLSDPGDLTVPINNQVALARAGGLLGDFRTDPSGALARNDELVVRQVMLGHDRPYAPYDFPLYDVDDRDANNCTQPSVEYPEFTCAGLTEDDPRRAYCDRCAPVGPLPPVDTGSGKALIRFPFAKKHEFFGIPLGPEYAVFTVYAQNQAGAFLGAGGHEWDGEAWDCLIPDETCAMAKED